MRRLDVLRAPLSLVPTALGLLLLAGCTQTAVPVEAAEAHAACGEAEGEEDYDCTHGAGTAALTDDRVEVRTVDGREVTHAGRPFEGAETVAVAELLADPAAYAGRTVRVEGDVAAMCTHRRGWFAVAAGDQSGRTVRIVTAPTFLVPQGSVGRAAAAEGTVEVIEVEAEFAEHLAADHKLEKPAKDQEKVQQVILRASGADFS